MLEYTIAHFAKNQEIFNSLQSNLLVDSTLSKLYGVPSSSNIQEISNLLNDLVKFRELMDSLKNFNKKNNRTEQDFEAVTRSLYINKEYENTKGVSDVNYLYR